jgi:hypothetical protein
MKLWIDINTPTTMHLQCDWPGLAHPATGDTVLFRKDNQTWVFQVLHRMLAIGIDPQTMEPVTHLILKVDSEAPEGFQP